MVRWEYKVESSDVGVEGIDAYKFEDNLNREGEQGWEVVSTECVSRAIPGLVVPITQLLVTFKRQVEPHEG